MNLEGIKNRRKRVGCENKTKSQTSSCLKGENNWDGDVHSKGDKPPRLGRFDFRGE